MPGVGGDREAVKPLIFFVNGMKVVDKDVDPEQTLLEYLRTKRCGEGGCGACTVMLSAYDPDAQKISHVSVNACLTPICSVHGMAVTTVEGIGSTADDRIHPAQERIAASHGSQCGFCTPGFVMSMYTLLRNDPEPSFGELEEYFQGNLCRCTGYRPIIDGYKSFTKEFKCPMGAQCCQMKEKSSNGSNGNENGFVAPCESRSSEQTSNIVDPRLFKPYDPSQEPIFPPELQVADFRANSTTWKGRKTTWHRPATLEELLSIKATHPEAKIVAGNTEIGLEVRQKFCEYPVLVDPRAIKELSGITSGSETATFGASTTLSAFEEALKEEIAKREGHQSGIFAEFLEMLKWFAGKQIRNVASLAGNIMTSSPISDLNPLFLASRSVLHLQKMGGKREVPMDSAFFTGYRKNLISPEEIITAVTIPCSQKFEYFKGFKQAKRREDDISIVNAGLRVKFDEETGKVVDCSLVFGGMAATTVVAKTAEAGLLGKEWNQETFDETLPNLLRDLPLAPGAPGGMEQYRRTLVVSFFYKFWVHVSLELEATGKFLEIPRIPEGHRSAVQPFEKQLPKSSQVFQLVPDGQQPYDAVGRPLVHHTAFEQATGEARYADDVPMMKNEVHMAFVLSKRAHAEILAVDFSQAMGLPGVVGYVSSKDVTLEQNITGVGSDEEVFRRRTVTSEGQIIAGILAETPLLAKEAARMVRVEYKNLEPLIITIEDAIRANSFLWEDEHSNGPVDEIFQTAEHVISGEARTGSQEHFYLETQGALAYPKGEHGEIEIVSSAQGPSDIQALVAKALGVTRNRVVVKVKRIGGGFGGKESAAFIVACPTAVAARKYKRPVRCILDRDTDMVMTGHRHPFMGRYKVAFDSSGKVLALDIHLYSNGGHSADLSQGVMLRAMVSCCNSYNISTVRCKGSVCKTNLTSSTAFRGFGAIQAMMICEQWMERIAEKLGLDAAEVREKNLLRTGDVLFYQHEIERCSVDRCWAECLAQSGYFDRLKEVKQFNDDNRWKKRGLAVVPVCYGVAFLAPFLNQGGALVHIYTDGTVLVNHGGVEMGQGLNIKLMQVASRALRIPVSKIHVLETSTSHVPNTSPSAASMTSDIFGAAVQDACQVLLQRLEPFIMADPKGNWEEWVTQAYKGMVPLSATGFYGCRGLKQSWKEKDGRMFSYETYGVACSEVEIDCLTGDHKVRRTDIVMDIGESLNPAIDVGQIEGAFTQGYGLWTMEEMLWSSSGTPLTRGPSTYKIPGLSDIPEEMNVALLRGAPNPRAVYSSKAVGEPPLFLSASVFFAIRNAIKASRVEAGLDTSQLEVQLDCPATAEKIRLACQDHISSKVEPPVAGSYRPWTIIP